MPRKVKLTKYQLDVKRRQSRDQQLIEELKKIYDARKGILETPAGKNDRLLVWASYHSYEPEEFLDELQGRSLPEWHSLTQNLKLHIAMYALNAFGETTQFNCHLHPDYESELLSRSPPVNIKTIIRNRLSMELGKVFRRLGVRSDYSAAFFFAIEGHDKSKKIETNIHIHGSFDLTPSFPPAGIRAGRLFCA